MCETVLSIYRCPATISPEHIFDVSCDGWAVQRRVPCTYLAVCSGVIVTDVYHGDAIDFEYWQTLDGSFMRDNPRRVGDILDGLSNTAFVGESEPNPIVQIPGRPEDMYNRLPSAAKDHWALGGDDGDMTRDMSESLGSLGVPLNVPIQQPGSFRFDAYEIGYRSNHGGGANFVFGDGSVKFITDGAAPGVLKAYGTRAGGETTVQQ